VDLLEQAMLSCRKGNGYRGRTAHVLSRFFRWLVRSPLVYCLNLHPDSLSWLFVLAPKVPKTEREKFETIWKAYQGSKTSEEQVCLASIRWLMSQNLLRRFDKKVDPKAELQAHLDRIKKVEAIAKERFDAGRTALADYKTGTFFRLQAEEWLAQGKTFEAKDLDPGTTSKGAAILSRRPPPQAQVVGQLRAAWSAERRAITVTFLRE